MLACHWAEQKVPVSSLVAKLVHSMVSLMADAKAEKSEANSVLNLVASKVCLSAALLVYQWAEQKVSS